jgi:hypothetical protein
MSETYVVRALVLGLLLMLSHPSLADRIHMKNGSDFDVDTWREDGPDIVYQRFGGEIRVPKDDVLRIERAAPVDTMTQTPRGSPPPVAPPQPTRPTRAAPPVDWSPLGTPDEGSTFAVRNVRYQLIESTPAGSRFSWWITIENLLTDEANAIDVTIVFGDGQGGRLYESPKHRIELRPREKGTVTGSAQIASDVAARIYGAGYSAARQ